MRRRESRLKRSRTQIGRMWRALAHDTRLRLALEFTLLALALVVMRRISVAIWRLPNGDVVEYHTYALAFWTQHPLFHAFPTEYPPLAILPFTTTLLPPLTDFQSVFTYWMGALVLLGYAGYLRFSDRKRALAYFIYMVVGAAATVVTRFDIVPALVTLAALWAAQRRHFAGAYILLALGVLLKLYPIFLVPLVAIEQWRALVTPADSTLMVASPLIHWPAGRRVTMRAILGEGWHAALHFWRTRVFWRVIEGMTFCLGVVALGFVVTLILNPVGALSGFQYAGDRPLQVESTPATLLWLGTLFGIPAQPVFSFVSLNYVGPLDVILKPLSAVALVIGCLWTYWRLACGRLTLAQSFLGCLAAVIVTNKIFSPQYLIWIIPFVAEVEGLNLAWLLVCALTTTIFPYLYGLRKPVWTVTFGWEFMPAVALRNLLLVYVTIRSLLRRPLSAT
ncbi:MAG: glycosyltransferase 87 family protein, partial [Ktedonobacterales bacterium]